MVTTRVKQSSVIGLEVMSDAPDFEQIYAEYRPKIHRFLMGMVGEYEAEDLTQEVFIKVNLALDTFRGDSKLSTWIYRIATNAALDRLRSPTFQRFEGKCAASPAVTEEEAENDEEELSREKNIPPVEQQADRKSMNECILGFVNSLPETYRTALVLSEFEGLSNSAIADILGVTIDTVKIRLHRAREKLKVMLAQNCGVEWVEGNEFVPELKHSDFESLKP
jgi:RNA polymerase sigma-70 factor, ECF subfamily